MGEWTYLSVASRLGRERQLLTAKRHYPFAWALAFESVAERAVPKDGRLVAPLDEAIERLRRRAQRLSKKAGPKLTAVLTGFVEFVAAQDGKSLVFDASEMASAYGDATELANVTSLAARLDRERFRMTANELEEWGIDDELDDDAPYSLELADAYYFFGASIAEEHAWLRPPEADDDERIAQIKSAFESAGYAFVRGPSYAEGGITLELTHPRHRGVTFVVDESFGFRATCGRRDDASIELGPDIHSAEKLAAWARHVADHFELLAPRDGGPSEWWKRRGGEAFGERMSPLAADVERLQRGMPARLDEAVRDLTRNLERGPRALDLGPLGSLVFERVIDPAWEPHVRASLQRAPGDATWRWAKPEFFVPPSMQHALIGDWLNALATAAARGGAVVVANGNAPQLTVHSDRVEPERFVDSRFAEFLPARSLAREEVEGRYIFVGANLVIVATDDTRTGFKFAVPADFDKTITPKVSGFWTAKSGERFASVLRVGARAWRFDNDGKLIASE